MTDLSNLYGPNQNGLLYQIQPIDASVGSNILTLTLNPTVLNFRSSSLTNGVITRRVVASPITLTVPSGATLGTVSGVSSRLVLIAIDVSGTVELAVANLSGGFNLDETTLINTTAIDTASDYPTIIYSTTARTGVPFRTVGFINITEATAGTWATSPTFIQGSGGRSLENTQNFPFVFRNRIINGDMKIDQRNAGVEIIPASSAYTLDRYQYYASVASKIKVQQVVDAPTGFTYSAKLTVAAQYSPTTNDYFHICQIIEGYNTTDLAWGTASASPITVSFWVKGSVPGTYGGVIVNGAVSISYPFTFSVTTSWTKQIIVVPGCLLTPWYTDNRIGVQLKFCLGVGTTYSGTAGSWQSANIVGISTVTQFVNQTVGSTLNITGVQIEKGSISTDFEFRPHSVELALCQRYYEQLIIFIGAGDPSNAAVHPIYGKYVVFKRATPTLFVSSTGFGTGTGGTAAHINAGVALTGVVPASLNSLESVGYHSGVTGGSTAGYTYFAYVTANADF